MVMNENATVLADDGKTVFEIDKIEEILAMAYDYDYSSGDRRHRFTEEEVCDNFDISLAELSRMKFLLSAEYNFDENGGFKYHASINSKNQIK